MEKALKSFTFSKGCHQHFLLSLSPSVIGIANGTVARMDQCLLSVQMVHAFLKVPVCTKRLRIKNTLVTSADVICFCLGKLQINSANLIYQNLNTSKSTSTFPSISTPKF